MLIIDLFLLRDAPYRHAVESPAAPWVVSACLTGVGTVLGAMLTVYAVASGQIRGVELDPALLERPHILFLLEVVAGLAIVLLLHIGITLFTWLAAKGIGGPGYLVALYRMTGYALPLGIPAVPAIAKSVAFIEPPTQALPLDSLSAPLAAAGALLFLAGLFHILRLSQGKSLRLTALGVVIFAVLTAAAIYLA